MGSRAKSAAAIAATAAMRCGLGLGLGALWILLPRPGAGAAPQPKAPPPQASSPATAAGAFAEITEVTAVQVPVQVVRGGEPVRGLTAADFEIYDGRRKQTVTGFEVLDLAARQGQAVASIPPSLRRHFLFLFDLSFSEPRSLVKARQMVRQMLPALHPSDLVAVASYSSAYGPQQLLGFTSDRSQVLRALDRLGAPQLVDRNPDPLNLWLLDVKQGMRGGEALDLYEPIDPLPAMVRQSERMNRQQQATVVRAFAASVADLAGLLAGVHGRKQVIYLSEGFDASLLQGTDDQKEKDRLRDLVIGGRGYEVDSEERYGETRSANGLEKMMEQFRRSDCVVQSVDIGGLRTVTAQGGSGFGEAPVRPAGEGTLFTMAHDTGGELYRNFNDLGAAMAQLLRKTGVTYVLTFQPDQVKRDGSYHQLRVQLKGAAARGAQAFFRPGYYAPRPYGQLSAKEKLMTAAEHIIGGGDGGPVAVAVLAAPFRRAAEPAAAAAAAPAPARAYVPVVIEADGTSLMSGGQEGVMGAEVYAYAIDASGAIQDFFTQNVRLDLAKVGPALRRTGLKYFGHLDLPPGEYDVRVLVRNSATGAYGLRAQPLVVPAFGQPGPVLLPPFFPEAPGRWVVVREAPRGQPREPPPYPFVVQARAYVPSSRPLLPAGQEAVVALVGYDLPAGRLEARARLLAADGKDAGEGDIKIALRESPDAAGEERLTAIFRPPRGLAPGEYQLVIVLTDAQGVAHDSATRLVVPAPVGGARG
jgi:VWFA-related protein